MRTKFTIGIDCLFADPTRVFGMWAHAINFVRELVDLVPDYELILFLNGAALDDCANLPKRIRVVPVRAANWSVAARIAWQNLVLPFQLKSHGVQLLHSLANYGPYIPGVTSIVTVHDLLPFYDRQFFPDQTPLARVLGIQVLVRRSLEVADSVIVDSEYSRRELLRRYPVSPDKVTLVYPGLPVRKERSDAIDLLASLGVQRPFIFTVGVSTPHKNIPRLIRAFGLLKRKGLRHQLVLGGDPGAQRPILTRVICEEGLADHVVLVGRIPDRNIDQLYRESDFFVFPSLMEGFGLPVLEAMAHGKPVVCSDAGPLPEVAADAALFFDPNHEASIAAAMWNVLHNEPLRDSMGKRGLQRAQAFSYRKTAEATLRVYEQALGRNAQKRRED